MTPTLTAALRTFLDLQHRMAAHDAKTRPYDTVPPGDDPRDWRLYLNVGVRPLVDEAMAAGVWEPPV